MTLVVAHDRDASGEIESADARIGAAVRTRRRQLGMSQERLAEKIGVSFQQVQKYENGANRISFSRLVMIAKALKIRVVTLIDLADIDEGDDFIEVERPVLSDVDLRFLEACRKLGPVVQRSALEMFERIAEKS